MASYNPCVKNDPNGWIGYVYLSPRTPTGQFQNNPTLATGDVKISKDGGAFANLNTLPAVTPAAGGAVKITLSQTETDADNIVIQFIDAAGAEWCDYFINLQTVSGNFDSVVTTLSTIAGYIDTEVAAIKAKTDNLPNDPADASDIAASFASIAATLATIAAYIDTEVAAIKAKTDNLPSDPADQSVLAALIAAVPAGVLAEPVSSLSLAELMRAIEAVLLGKNNPTTSSDTFRNVADTKDVVVATINTQGRRTSVTLDTTP